jgi:phosphate transport system permease protein
LNGLRTTAEQNSPEPENQLFDSNVKGRNRKGATWRLIFLLSTIVGIIALSVLILTIIDDIYGLAAIEFKVPLSEIVPAGKTVDDITCQEADLILQENVSKNRYNTLQRDQPITERSQEECARLIIYEIAKPVAKATWSFSDSMLNGDEIQAYTAERFPEAELVYKKWLTKEFITSPQSDDPLTAGIITAILGSLWIIAIVIVVAFPIGVGAAIYLEEYANDNMINRIIRTNINNLAGVPSIIYGMLGLAFFVRVMEPVTSGTIFGFSDPGTANGRTILAAGLTLALLIVPVIIINGQEAIRAVPTSLRQASYGLGATKWQTIWHHVIPNAIPGILTGTILSIARAFGETAPLVVVGAATYITFNPESIFSKFTTLPIQIYQWTSRPQDAYGNIAASAIIVLVVLLIALNATAIYLRNRYSRRLV